MCLAGVTPTAVLSGTAALRYSVQGPTVIHERLCPTVIQREVSLLERAPPLVLIQKAEDDGAPISCFYAKAWDECSGRTGGVAK